MNEQTISVCRNCLTELFHKYEVPTVCSGCGEVEPARDEMTEYEHEMALKIHDRLVNEKAGA